MITALRRAWPWALSAALVVGGALLAAAGLLLLAGLTGHHVGVHRGPRR